MKINRFSTICFIFLSLFGCSSDENPAFQNENDSRSEGGVSQASSSTAPPVQTNVYRLLTAMRTNVGNKAVLAVACEQRLGFNQQMTGRKVVQAREIDIPISATVHNPVVYVTRYRTERVQPASVNGIVFNAEEKHVSYKVQEVLPGSHYVEGSCLGSEYITE